MAAPIGPYSPAFRAGDLLFCSGQLGLRDGELVDGLGEQVRQALNNLVVLLDEYGLVLADVAKTTVFLTDMADFPAMNDIYAEVFGEARPARSTVAVAGLPKGALLEIEAIASVS